MAEAFAVLSDQEKRARYDRGGHEAFGAGFDPFAGADFSQFDFGFGNLSDLFEMFSGPAAAAAGGPRARAAGKTCASRPASASSTRCAGPRSS